MTSRVGQFIRSRADELAYVPEPEEEEKKVTVRVPVSVINTLDALAGKLSMTRTGLAEHLLVISVDEAFSLTQQDPYLIQRQGIDPRGIALIAEQEEAEAAA